MSEYTYDSRSLKKDGRPWFPVMGEMHYTRYKEELWEESLRKMKAGGVTVVSTYVIWIHHEEEKGVFDFSGCRDLNRYLKLCGKVGLEVLLRLGPWVHGEVRNGGFPDWVVELGKEGVGLRSNDEAYLGYVRRYWQQIWQQVQGLLVKDGGPVIGVQIENEYGHVGGHRGEEGEAHMRRLTALAKEIGLDVPLYTATGWGGACIGDCLPVMGGYCEAPWSRSIEELPPNSNFVISHVRNDALIACDHHVEGAVTFDESRFPYLTAELGGGMQATSHRRPVSRGKDVGAMSVTKLASGAALLGYYMYHGGSNPKGRLSTLQESKATGYANDLPEINYDFHAPIGQYGTISDSYREIKLLALFLKDFGEDLAKLPSVIEPEGVKPWDLHTLRRACRHDGGHGYVFFNNYQRRHRMEDHDGIILKGHTADGDVCFPATDIRDGDYGFFPYRMRMGDAVLETALATPLCRLKGSGEAQSKEETAGDTYVFYGDRDPQYCWRTEKRAEILHLNREQALRAYKVRLDRDYLILCDGYVWEEGGELRCAGGAVTTVRSFPALKEPPRDFVEAGGEGRLMVYRRTWETSGTAEYRLLEDDGEEAVYEICISYPDGFDSSVREKGKDLILELDYSGFGMDVWMGEEKINDHFYDGERVPLSLGYFCFPESLKLHIRALHEKEPIFLEKWPKLVEGKACRLNGIFLREECW